MNIILIGMPGAGKSTAGVLLAKALNMDFLDTDIVIQQRENNQLWKIIGEKGLPEFLAAEERALLSVERDNTVIATGGSAVLSRQAMEHLLKNGKCVYLKSDYESLKKRIKNIKTRGIAMDRGQTLLDVYKARVPLYEKYAEITVDCGGDVEATVSDIVSSVCAK